jgi:Transposase DDE domain
VFHYFRAWRIDDTWERMNRAMRRRLSGQLGRDPEPSAGIVDSQSAKTSGVGGEQRGFDGGKKVRGRKRHILVNTEGLVVEARVHSARVPDQASIRRLLESAKYLHPHTRLPPVSPGVTQAPQARLAERGRLPNNSVLMPMHELGAEWTRKATAKRLLRIPREETTRGDENRADRNSGLRCRMA